MARFRNQYQHRPHKLLDLVRWKLGLTRKLSALTDEAMDEPPRLLARELALRGPASAFRTLKIGQTIDIA